VSCPQTFLDIVPLKLKIAIALLLNPRSFNSVETSNKLPPVHCSVLWRVFGCSHKDPGNDSFLYAVFLFFISTGSFCYTTFAYLKIVNFLRPVIYFCILSNFSCKNSAIFRTLSHYVHISGFRYMRFSNFVLSDNIPS
jgi:hypothetical protein